MYGKVLDIKCNPLKSQVVTFGGRVKCLGCYFSSPSDEVDLSQSVSKCHGSSNNIFNRHKTLAVHRLFLIKTYRLSSAA